MNELYQDYIIAFAYLAGGLLLGVFTEKILLKKLRKVAIKTTWTIDEIILDSFKGLIIFLGFVAGIYFAILHLPFKETVKSVSGKVMFSFTVFIITMLAARIVVGMIRGKAAKSTGLLPTSSIIANITRITIFVIGILIILQTLGVSITPLLTALGVGGLAVALALQDTLSNLFSGIQVIASRQIRPGDYIKLDSGEEGYVVDITWRNTTIRMVSNNLIVVPNSKVASAILTNYYLPDKETSLMLEVGVSYDSNLDEVERITIQAAEEIMKTVEGGVKDFTPLIRYHTFADSSIGFRVVLRSTEFNEQHIIRHELIKLLHKRYKENSIEIPFPIRTVLMKNQED